MVGIILDAVAESTEATVVSARLLASCISLALRESILPEDDQL